MSPMPSSILVLSMTKLSIEIIIIDITIKLNASNQTKVCQILYNIIQSVSQDNITMKTKDLKSKHLII